MTGNLHFLLLLAFLPFLLLFYFPSSLGHSRSRFNGQGAVWSSLWLDCGSGEHGGCGQLVMWLGVAIIVCVQSECACSQVVLYRYLIVSTVRWMTLLRTVVQKAHTRWGRPAMSCDHHGMSCHVIIVMSRDHRGMSHDMRPSWCHVTIVGCHMTCDHCDVLWSPPYQSIHVHVCVWCISLRATQLVCWISLVLRCSGGTHLNSSVSTMPTSSCNSTSTNTSSNWSRYAVTMATVGYL